MQTQLLCTFANPDILENTLKNIRESYVITYNYIYVLENAENAEDLFITYNINKEMSPVNPLIDTILIHRKKETNTLYTINALNRLIKQSNGGNVDNTFVIDWDKYQNSIILTDSSSIKITKTLINTIIKFDNVI